MEQDLNPILSSIKKLNSKLCCIKKDLDSEVPVTLTYDGETGELTLTDQHGVDTTVILPLEQFLSQASYDNNTNILTLTMSDGTSFSIDLVDLVDAATPPGGLTTQIQYNNAGVFGGSSQLIANIGTTNTLDIQGSGSTNATNALRVRNSAGTLGLLVRNDGGVSIGTTANYGSLDIKAIVGSEILRGYNSGDVLIYEVFSNSGYAESYIRNNSGTTRVKLSSWGASEFSLPTASSTPTLLVSGTGYSGGTSTTTKPTLLIEPTGTTSTGWSTSGTKLGVNAESGFVGNLLDLQLNGVSAFSVNRLGALTVTSDLNAGGNTSSGVGNAIYWRTRSQMWSDADGNIRLVNTAGTTFGLLQFGGTTSSYPAIKRNSTGLDIRLADDSGYGALSAKRIILGGLNDIADGIKLNRSIDGSTMVEITAGGSHGLINICGFATSSSGLRLLGSTTGLSYIDGYSEGATKAQNYDIIIGSRVNNTTNSLTGNTTAETGTNVQIGFATVTNPRAILSLNTTTRGFLPPRMTTTQRDAVTWVAGDAGMIIFNSTLIKLQVWNGSAWETVTSL